MTQAVTLAQLGNSGVNFRNKIINGDMRIDQRNAGAIQTPVDSGYTLDRWKYYSSQSGKLTSRQTPSTTETGYLGRLAAGFSNYLAYTSTSAYTVTGNDYFCPLQGIEGYNIADFAFGTSSAKPITLSFWVNSSLTGTFTGALTNSGNTRSIAFTYTISSANTWEQKSITLPGCTDGTWNITTGMGIEVRFSLGVTGGYAASTTGVWAAANYVGATGGTSVVGTNGATWYVTGVQLEAGSVATPFEQRPFGTELAMCQRYYWRWSSINQAYMYISSAGRSYSTTNGTVVIQHPVPMRTQAAMNNSNNFAANNWDYSVTGVGINNSGYAAFPFNLTNLNVTGTFPAGDRSFTLGSGSSSSTTIWIEFTSEL
jgi:hypothetical protein